MIKIFENNALTFEDYSCSMIIETTIVGRGYEVERASKDIGCRMAGYESFME